MADKDPNPGTSRGSESRDGPRPLPLHLATAMVGWTSSLAALPIARSGSPLWNPPLRREGEALARDLAAVPPDRLAAAVPAEIAGRSARPLRAVERLPAPPARRVPAPQLSRAAWRERVGYSFE